MDIRVVFMGSPDFAVPSLKLLAEKYHLVGAVTQPDRPAGRGRVMTPPPVKILAEQMGIPVIQPERLREPAAFERLQAWQPDLIAVTAFGQILRQNVLDLPRFGCVNVHASLLPRWRGAAPIQASILHGDQQTGVTIMKLDAGMDTGPILAQRIEEIQPVDTSGSLAQRLAIIGADLLIDTLPGYLDGKIIPILQENELATLAPMIRKEEGLLNFEQPAEFLTRKIRAFHPWPGTFFHWMEGMLKVHQAHTVEAIGKEAGQKLVIDGFPAVACSSGCLVLDIVQLPGKKPMPGDIFLRGARQW
jgi:methionyl-tRNA formyltransferase